MTNGTAPVYPSAWKVGRATFAEGAVTSLREPG